MSNGGKERKSPIERNYTGMLLKPSFVARLFNVSDTTIRKWIKSGFLEAVQLPTKIWRIKGESVTRLLAGNPEKKEEDNE